MIPATDPPQAVTHRSIIVCCSPGECGVLWGYCGGAHLHEFQSTCSRAWLIRDGSEHPEGAQGLLMRNGACAYAMAVGALVLMRKALVKPGCRTSCTANAHAEARLDTHAHARARRQRQRPHRRLRRPRPCARATALQPQTHDRRRRGRVGASCCSRAVRGDGKRMRVPSIAAASAPTLSVCEYVNSNGV